MKIPTCKFTPRDEKRLFKWSKSGILMNIPNGILNLSEAIKMNEEEVFDMLDRMLEGELTPCQKRDIEEVIDELKNNK